jgi:hypothetical protein
VKTDRKGRSYGTPSHPQPPTHEEFHGRFREVLVEELNRLILVRRHGLMLEQAASVSRMTNEELIAWRLDDPISAIEVAGGLSLTGGHHRTWEIAHRVDQGTMPSGTRVWILIHD